MKKFLPNWRLLSFFILYFLVVLYTLTFPTTVSWFVFYAFTFLLLLSFLSTKLFFRVENIRWQNSEANDVEVSFDLASFGFIPFFLPTIKLILSKGSHKKTVLASAFFSRRLACQFSNFSLPRGHHEQLDLTIQGTGLFGIFRYQAKRKLTVSIDVYPKPLPKSARTSFLQTIVPALRKKKFSTLHEFHMRDIRKYQERDSLSDVDWKSSLRRDEWMIKEYDSEEPTPIGIYFFGLAETHFEELLALTYSLYQDLAAHQNVQLFLFGEFNEEVAVDSSKESFLSIQPTKEKEKLSSLWLDHPFTKGKKIIIAPKSYKMPSHPAQKEELIHLTEDQFFM